MWIRDEIMRGFRYVETWDGITYRTAAYVSRIPDVERNLHSAIALHVAGKPNNLKQTGDAEFTLPAVL